MRSRLRLWTAAAMLAASLLQGCGGGASATADATPVNNVLAVDVTSGLTGEFANMVMTSVTICVPGTSTCQTIANVQVDTGSSGLRLLASAVTLPLPAVTSTAAGAPYSECAGFADGVVWGALARADVKLGGESAASMSVQIIQDLGVGPVIPASCLAQGASESTPALLGANGILGVGLFLQDCGAYCASTPDAIYYLCNGGGSCSGATIAVASQVSNPVAFFTHDNNGVILQLPAVAADGAAAAPGNLIFGIGTQSNNSLATTVIGVADTGATAGSFTAIYRGTTLANSFFDSGSSALYFDDTSLPACSSTGPAGDLSGFYCPGPATAVSVVPISVTLIGSNGVSVAVTASVANTQFLFTQPGAAALNAFDDLAGPGLSTVANAFDFGLPFFFGKSVVTAFEQRATPGGPGPYFAFRAYP
jgi:hypothetical protein